MNPVVLPKLETLFLGLLPFLILIIVGYLRDTKSEVTSSKLEALLLALLPFLTLLYFVHGAFSNRIYLSSGRGHGNGGVIIITGQSAWIACYSPLLWLLGSLIRYYPGLNISVRVRNVVSSILFHLSFAIFFYAGIRDDLFKFLSMMMSNWPSGNLPPVP